MYQSATSKMAIVVSAAMILAEYNVVEASQKYENVSIPLKQRRANRLTKSHARSMRQNGHLHTLDRPMTQEKKMIYPQSWSHKIGQLFGLYGAVGTDVAAPSSMTNYLDLVWTADFLIDSNEQVVPVMFDTMSHYLILEGCTPGTCTNRFDTTTGTYTPGAVSRTIQLNTNQVDPIIYSVSQGDSTGQVCFFDNTACEASVKMQVSDYVLNMPYVDVGGVAGLALGKGPETSADTTAPADADMFLTQLVTGGSSPNFAFNYGFGSTNVSYLELGTSGTDNTALKKSGSGYETKTFNVDATKYHWETGLRGIKFSTDEADEWGFKNTVARFSSAEQCIYAPNDHYALLKQRVMQFSLGYYEDSTYGIVVDCEQEDDLKDLEIMIGEDGAWHWTTVRVNDYLIPIDNSYQCQVCIRNTGLTDNTWYLGATWFSGYYVEFDRTANTVAVTPAQNGSKGPWATINDAPTRILGINETTVGLLSMGIGLCVIAFIILVIFAFCYLFTPKKASAKTKSSTHPELAAKLDELLSKSSTNLESSGSLEKSSNALV